MYFRHVNIQFNYRYRDGANYKQYNIEVFSNLSGLLLEEIDGAIKSVLIDGEWFYAEKWALKDMHVYKWDNSIDHEWHEYVDVEITEEAVTKGDIQDFLILIRQQ